MCSSDLADFEHAGKPVLASRLGYRITKRFVGRFFARIFNHPDTVFSDAMLHPELQNADVFADGMDNIVETQRRVAQLYFDDGSITSACPPLFALLHIMRDGFFDGKSLDSSEVRALFTRENMLASEWYAARLACQQTVDQRHLERGVRALTAFLGKVNYAEEATRLSIAARLEKARKLLDTVKAPEYLNALRGTIGAQPLQLLTHA